MQRRKFTHDANKLLWRSSFFQYNLNFLPLSILSHFLQWIPMASAAERIARIIYVSPGGSVPSNFKQSTAHVTELIANSK